MSPPVWHGIFNATFTNNVCPQSLNHKIIGTEDCLIVNVFKPNNGRTDNPVVVYIHGGGLFVGSGAMLLARSLTMHDIVSVTFNYRLGAHGFLCLRNKIIPGNAGLRDQLAALRWLKKNIRAFGGNPNNVTLAGYGAGAASVEILMLSPASKGLFHKVILESGQGIVPWLFDLTPIATAQKLGQALKAPDINNIKALSTFLAFTPIQELFSEGRFVPCIEDDLEGIEKIVKENPRHILQSNTYEKLPIMTGYTDAEGLITLTKNQKLMQGMNENFADYLPPLSFRNERQRQKIANQVKTFYFGHGPITDNHLMEFVHYYTNISFSYYSITSARLHKANGAKVFLYEYRYVDSQSLFGKPGFGANHGAQTYTILDPYMVQHRTNSTPKDDAMKALMVQIWAQFIKHG